MNTSSRADYTIAEILQSFWNIHWASYAPNSRGTRHGRLVVMAASLLDDPTSAQSVLARMRDKRLRHEDPTNQAGWVARYLLKHFLRTPEYTAETRALESQPELEAAARWVVIHSKLANEITGEDLIRLRVADGRFEPLHPADVLVSRGDGAQLGPDQRLSRSRPDNRPTRHQAEARCRSRGSGPRAQ